MPPIDKRYFLPFVISDLVFGSISVSRHGPSTQKTISKVCLVFAILWFVGIAVLEAHYVFSVLRQEANLRHYHLLRMIYEEQIEGINFIL